MIEAIYKLYPSVVRTTGDTAYDADGNEVQYDKTKVEVYLESIAYKQQRAQAYPSIANQLDTLYHQGYEGWKATIEAVKLEFPKP